MICRVKFLVALGLISTWGAVRARGSEISIDAWTLRATVGIGNGIDSRVNTTVENPLSDFQLASLQSSTATSSYAASWDSAGFLDFLVEGEHAGQGTPGTIGFARSTGSIELIPAVDSTLVIDASYQFDLGSGDREAELTTRLAGGPAPGSVIHFLFQHALPIAGDPPTGTFTVNESFPLAAGATYFLNYTMALRSFGGSPSSLSLGDGYVHFSIAPVCEPTTCLLLLAAAPVLLRRRRRIVGR